MATLKISAVQSVNIRRPERQARLLLVSLAHGGLGDLSLGSVRRDEHFGSRLMASLVIDL